MDDGVENSPATGVVEMVLKSWGVIYLDLLWWIRR